MSPKKTEKSSGILRLFRNWEESASSHFESEDTADLIGNGDYVILEIHHERSNQYKIGSAVDTTTRHQIKVHELIDYIKNNGKQLTD